MPNIKIKEYQPGTFATGKCRLLDDERHNALFPEEIVEVSEQWCKAFLHLFKKNLLEFTIDAPTRPLLYESGAVARLHDPRHMHKGMSTILEEQEQIRRIMGQEASTRRVVDQEIQRVLDDEIARADAQREREDQVTLKASPPAEVHPGPDQPRRRGGRRSA